MNENDIGGEPPEDTSDKELTRELGNLIEGYPYGSPSGTIALCSSQLAGDPGGPGRGGWIMVLHALTWYATSGQIGSRHVLEEMIEALEAARGEPEGWEGCGHEGHPPVEKNITTLAELGVQLSTPGGQAYYAHDSADEYGEWADHGSLDELLCPAHLTSVADAALAELRRGLARLFDAPDLSHLDETYLRPDGRVDLHRLLDTIRRRYRSDKDADEAGLWAAQRWESGVGAPEDRLLLFVALCGAVLTNYPGMSRAGYDEVRRVAGKVDRAPLGAPCRHADGLHPWFAASKKAALGNVMARSDPFDALKAVYEPGEHQEPGGPFTREEWECPRHFAELARVMDERLDEWSEMRQYDYED
ncbi:hypothetical protein [Spirillospora sp. CA-128828]|uniref:hypothetical protein n=1 Tax=Spirillospora sp. CA-128828 TaxID=3240033 RepID=UPI003D94F021